MTPDLFADMGPTSARARTSDPQTSVAAAARVSEFAASHYAVILLALRDKGPASIYELAKRTKLDHVAIARRLPEMQDRALVDTTDEKRAGPTGRKCRVWRAV